MTPRQFGRLVSDWPIGIGLDPHLYGTHSLRRTNATLIYRRTGNLRVVQLFLVAPRSRALCGILALMWDDALAIAEQLRRFEGQTGQKCSVLQRDPQCPLFRPLSGVKRTSLWTSRETSAVLAVGDWTATRASHSPLFRFSPIVGGFANPQLTHCHFLNCFWSSISQNRIGNSRMSWPPSSIPATHIGTSACRSAMACKGSGCAFGHPTAGR